MLQKYCKLPDKLVSWYMYGLVVVMFMLALFFNVTYNLFDKFPGILEVYRAYYSPEIAKQRLAIENSILHTMAFSVVLVKAYVILMQYAKKPSY